MEKVHQMWREADTYGHVAHGIFQNEIPPDDPGDEFAHGGVRVRVGAASDGNHRREFSVADRSKSACDGNQYKGKRDCGAGPRAAERGLARDQILKERSIEDRRDLEFLTCDGSADNSENSRADYGSNPERGEA